MKIFNYDLINLKILRPKQLPTQIEVPHKSNFLSFKSLLDSYYFILKNALLIHISTWTWSAGDLELTAIDL